MPSMLHGLKPAAQTCLTKSLACKLPSINCPLGFALRPESKARAAFIEEGTQSPSYILSLGSITPFVSLLGASIGIYSSVRQFNDLRLLPLTALERTQSTLVLFVNNPKAMLLRAMFHNSEVQGWFFLHAVRIFDC